MRQTHPKNSSICALSIAVGPHNFFSQKFFGLTDKQVLGKHHLA